MKKRLITLLAFMVAILALMVPLMAQTIESSKIKIRFVKVPIECKSTNQQSDVANELALTNREPNVLPANTKIYWTTSYRTNGVVTLPQPVGQSPDDKDSRPGSRWQSRMHLRGLLPQSEIRKITGQH
jgi:hypothetical protein